MRRIDLTEEQIIEDFRRINREFGSITTRLYEKNGTWSMSKVEKYGTFNYFKRKALGKNSKIKTPIAKKELIEDVLSVYQEEGKLTQEIYVNKGRFSRKPIIRHFGSFNKMLNELNLPTNCIINISEEELLDELKRTYDDYETITATIVKHYGKYSLEVYQRRFGSFQKALDIAGIEIISHKTSSPIADTVIDIIEEILGEKAIREFTSPWLRNPKTKNLLYIDAIFPSYKIAIEYNGIQHYKAVEFYGGEEQYSKRLELDELKKDLLSKNGYQCITIKYDDCHKRTSLIHLLSNALNS